MTSSMLPDLQASFVCEDVRVEASGAHTIVGILNGIAAPKVPVRLLKMCIWSRWCTGSGDFIQTTRLLSPDEESIVGEAVTPFKLADTDAHVTNVNVFAGLEFQHTGNYHVEILLDGELRLRYPLRVFIPNQAPTQGPDA